jgi:hypothetical protein
MKAALRENKDRPTIVTNLFSGEPSNASCDMNTPNTGHLPFQRLGAAYMAGRLSVAVRTLAMTWCGIHDPLPFTTADSHSCLSYNQRSDQSYAAGRAARGLSNRFVEVFKDIGPDLPDFPVQARDKRMKGLKIAGG